MAAVFAAADIGSNTAHLLVAATDGQLVMRLDNVNEWVSLGEEVARHGEIRRERADELVGAIREFRKAAAAHAAKSLYVFATEAMRAAANRDELLARIKAETGVAVDLITPRREAELSLNGMLLDTRGAEMNLMFEVGGGSAQIAEIRGHALGEERSLPIGTGRVIAESGLQQPAAPETLRAAQTFVQRHLDACELQIERPVALVSGGVARGLWRAVHPDGEKSLHIRELDYLAWSVAELPLPRIIERFGAKPKRAGTLLAGALIYSALMNRFGLEKVHVSEFGIREGAVLGLARGKIQGAPL